MHHLRTSTDDGDGAASTLSCGRRRRSLWPALLASLLVAACNPGPTADDGVGGGGGGATATGGGGGTGGGAGGGGASDLTGEVFVWLLARDFSLASGTGNVENGEHWMVFSIESATNVAEDYDVAVRFRNVTGSATAADWQSGVELNDPEGHPITGPLRVEPGKSRNVNLSFSVPSGADTAELTLVAASRSQPDAPRLNKASNPPLRMKVGEPATTSGPRMRFSLQRFGPLSNARDRSDDGVQGIDIASGQVATVRADVSFTFPGAYTLSAELRGADSGWSLSGLTPTQVDWSEPGVTELGLEVTAPAGPSQQTLILKAERTDDDNMGDAVSWVEFPLSTY